MILLQVDKWITNSELYKQGPFIDSLLKPVSDVSGVQLRAVIQHLVLDKDRNCQQFKIYVCKMVYTPPPLYLKRNFLKEK